jgi:outer membrane autotransporter protein
MLQTSTALCSFHAIWISAVLGVAGAQAADPPFSYWNPLTAAQNWNGSNNWCLEAVTTCNAINRRAAPPTQQAIFQNPSFTNTITIDQDVKVGIITFPDANKTKYTFNVAPTGSLTFTRSDIPAQGIQNGGGALQTFVNNGTIAFAQQSSAASNIVFDNFKTLEFKDNSSLSSSKITNQAGATLAFRGLSNAGTSAAKINNLGQMDFFDAGNAAEAKITNQGTMIFNGTSSGSDPRTTAGTATINNEAAGQLKFQGFSSMGAAVLTNAGTTTFLGNSSAGSGTITNNKSLIFSDNSSGANSIITNNDTVQFNTAAAGGNAKIANNKQIEFFNLGNAGNATITNKAAAEIKFHDTSSAGGSVVTNEGNVYFLGNSSGGSATLNNSGSIFFSEFSTPASASIVNSTSGAVVDFSSIVPNLSKSAGSIAGPGMVKLGSNKLSVGGNDASTLFTGIFQDGGVNGGVGGSLVKEGTGKLALSGIQAFTGTTDVNAGDLNVNGSLESSSMVNVNAGGTLSGIGNFGNVNNNGGTISPGNSVGTLHINGSLTMGPNSKYYAELNGVASDRIDVSGTANVQSSIFEIAHDTDTSSAPVLPGKTYTVITTKRGLTVTAPTVTIADFPFLAFTLSEDAFNGYLTTSRSAERFADLASTLNQKAVANALDTAGAANPVWQQVIGSTDVQARAAFASLGTASIHANAAGVLSAQSAYLRDAVTDRLRQGFAYGTALAPAGSVLSYAPETRNAYAAGSPFYKAPPPVATSAPIYAVWAQGLGSRGSLKGDGNAASTDHSLGGVISGLDVTFNGSWRVGLAGGYSQSTFNSPGLAASGSSDSYHVALYGGGQVGAWGLRGGASFSWNDITTSRQVAVVNLAGLQRGEYTANTTQVFGEVGRSFAFATGALEPFANIAYVHVNGGVNELGAAAMTGSMGLDTTYTTLGVRGATALTNTLTARGTLGWRHALGDITPVAALAFQSGGTAFSLAGSPIARDALVAEAGLDFDVAANVSLGVSWTGQFADTAYDNTVKGNLTWRF